MENYYIVIPLLALIAFLYSSVGHGGASGYLGMMVLLGISPALMKPSALLLNILVSAIATYQFYRAGHFKKDLFIPFIILSVPFSFMGSKISLADPVYKTILGICLLIAVARMLIINTAKTDNKKQLPLLPALGIGAGIGLISGMIGIGGGILLTPLLLLFRWADVKEAAAVSAPFILLNSISGIVGLASADFSFAPETPAWVVAAAMGGIAGSYWGSKKFNNAALKYVLSGVMVIAAAKLFIS